jgi:hypothetical protein
MSSTHLTATGGAGDKNGYLQNKVHFVVITAVVL